MKKILKLALALVLCATVTACGSSDESGSDTIKGTYSINITGEDWGCGVDKAIITMDNVLDSVTKDDFKVTETKQTTDWADPEFPVIETTVDREVTDAYLCDEAGNKVDEASKYVALELYISPNDGSPFLYTMSTGYNTWSDPYFLTITLADGAEVTSAGTAVTTFEVETEYTSRTTNADNFEKFTGTYEGVDYNYATYTPEGGSDKVFVWLNGAGEGGSATLGDATNVEVTLLANKVTALAGEDFQTTLGGCNVLVPQAPTMWMDDGQGNTTAGPRNSMYIESLVALIDDYVAKNDIKTVIIGGCSNGGYMTMNVAMNYGDKYQAYIPICEAMLDEHITDEDIQVLKDLPLYFVYSENDDTVVPANFEIPTIKRLKEAGATNLHVSTTADVHDTSGKYKDEDGNPHQYSGHWSWIYFDNDETADENGVSAFDWIAETIK